VSRVVQATAPGKLVFAGEYAVLEGAPAIATSVGARARATVADLAGKTYELCINNSDTIFRFAPHDDGSLDWLALPARDTGLIEAVYRTLVAADLWQPPPEALRIQLDSRAFFTTTPDGVEHKLGFGSSAAVCVALTAALLWRAGIAPEAAPALNAHRLFQAGKGSGIDVACSFAGGTIEYFRSVSGSPAWRNIPWPDGLYVLPVWTGLSASTAVMLDKLDNYRQAEPASYDNFLADLTASSNYVVTQWEAGQAAIVLAAIEDFSQHLRALDTTAGVGIWSEIHQTLGRIAAEAGAVYKPSGAGGGDFGLAFANDPDRLDRLRTKWRAQDFVVPELEFDVRGVEVSDL
jgi:phosphomevalonate kinase